jgi:hypothetical protein
MSGVKRAFIDRDLDDLERGTFSTSVDPCINDRHEPAETCGYVGRDPSFNSGRASNFAGLASLLAKV